MDIFEIALSGMEKFNYQAEKYFGHLYAPIETLFLYLLTWHSLVYQICTGHLYTSAYPLIQMMMTIFLPDSRNQLPSGLFEHLQSFNFWSHETLNSFLIQTPGGFIDKYVHVHQFVRFLLLAKISLSWFFIPNYEKNHNTKNCVNAKCNTIAKMILERTLNYKQRRGFAGRPIQPVPKWTKHHKKAKNLSCARDMLDRRFWNKLTPISGTEHLLPTENEFKLEEATPSESFSSSDNESSLTEDQTDLKVSSTKTNAVIQNKMEPTLDTFLHACLYGHKDVIRKLIARHGNSINFTKVDSVTGYTGFHLACTGGHLSVVQQLLTKFGSSICRELVNNDGLTGLELAAQFGRKDVVKAILETIKGKHLR